MAGPKAPSLSEALISALDELSEEDFDLLKLLLEDSAVLGEFEVIPRHKLKTKKTPELLKAMKDNYGIFTISVMKTLLEELHCRRVLQELSQCGYDPHGVITACQKQLQSSLQLKFKFLIERLFKSKDSVPFDEAYTELFIIEADTGQVTEQHEVRQMEIHFRTSGLERTILYQDIFEGSTETGEPIRAVLTKGVAGVGKTVLTQKFSLDWAEGRAHQDIQLVFHFTFRYLNKFRGREFSLVGLLHHCFRETKALFSFQCLQLLFIFDGLDECRLPLDFSRTRVLTDPTESASVEELLVNLIRGDLLPSARLWITTRPAAANQIPAECVSMVTEVRGFSDKHKEQYFMKRIQDEQQATAVISHIKRIRNLYIMSRIPIFCWILSNVLPHLMKTTVILELPTTLTQVYVHFLVIQAKVKNIKFHGKSGTDRHWTPETIEMVRSLGKLAFEQLLEGNLIFYESDLSECGLDPAEIAQSGVFTEVFKEESGLYQDKVYCFIHLSVQEFLAALHVHHTFYSSGVNLLSPPCSSDPEENLPSPLSSESQRSTTVEKPRESSFFESNGAECSSGPEEAAPCFSDPTPEEKLLSPPLSSDPTPEEVFYCSAVDLALQSPNGHLDLFLRFLLGLSLPTNQSLLSRQLSHTGSEQTNQKTAEYIKEKLNEEGASAERSLNLLHCLNEVNDHSLLEQTQLGVIGGVLSVFDSPAQWSALSFILLSSHSDLEEFDLRKYQGSEGALLKLLPVARASAKVTVSGCGLTALSCGPGAPLASVLCSSSLTQLDLSNNDLLDSGVELLCEGLKSAPCRLEILRMSGCMISERGGASLAAALSPAPSRRSPTPSCLRELDLSYNDPGSSVELLATLRAPQGPLQTLRLDPAGQRWMVPGLRKYSCEFSLDPNTAHRVFLLSEDLRSVSRGAEELLPDHEDRFTHYCQVLSSSGQRGRCYWEADWHIRAEGGRVYVAVSYRGIRRRGVAEECLFGRNDVSWCLEVDQGGYAVHHNKQQESLRLHRLHGVGVSSGREGVSSGRVGVSSGRVGVFLDSEGGALSFYDVGPDGGLSQIHSFSSCFSEPLFAGFALAEEGSSVALVNLNGSVH